MSKTTLGLNENIEGLLCYSLGIISGFVFLIIERESDFVRFHAMQSLVTFLGLIVVSMVITIVGMLISLIPIVGILFGIISLLINLLLPLVGIALWILGMYKAYKGERYKFPIFGDITENLLKESND